MTASADRKFPEPRLPHSGPSRVDAVIKVFTPFTKPPDDDGIHVRFAASIDRSRSKAKNHLPKAVETSSCHCKRRHDKGHDKRPHLVMQQSPRKAQKDLA